LTKQQRLVSQETLIKRPFRLSKIALVGAVMKKTALVLVLVTVVFIGLIANSLPVIRVAKANPYTAPEVTFLPPINNTAYSTTSLTFNFLVESISFMDFDYYYSLDDRVSKEPIHVKLVSQRQDPTAHYIYETYQFSADLHNLTDGQHVLTLHHEAPYYSWFYGEEVVREASEPPIIFYIDTLAPTISNLSVNETDLGDKLLSFTVDEEATWVGYSLDNQANVTISDEVVLKDLPVGSHNVTVYAKDAAGNIAASETLFFSIAEPFPTTLVATASVVSMAIIIGIGLTVYFKKSKRDA